MNRLSKVLLIVVLVSLVGVPVLAAPPDAEFFKSKFLEISDWESNISIWAGEGESPSNTYSYLYISTPQLQCNFDQFPIDLPNMTGVSPIKWELAVPIDDECWINYTGLSEIVFDLTLTPNLVTHGNYHSNVLVGDWQGQQCQNWQKSGNEVSGTINGEALELSEYGQFSAYDDSCTFK